MIAVRMGVNDHQRDGRLVIPLAPGGENGGNSAGSIRFPRAGIFQQSAVFSEDQVKERLFVVGTAGLAKDIEIFVVLMNLPVWNFDAIRPAGNPEGS